MEFEYTAEGFEEMVGKIGQELTARIHNSAEELSAEEKDVEIDLSGIQIITSLENLGGIGTTMGDETPIRMSIEIPQFTFEAGVTNGWNGISMANQLLELLPLFSHR